MTAHGAGGLADMGMFAKAAWSRLALMGLALGWLLAATAQQARADEALAASAQPQAATLVIHVENVRQGGILRLGLYDQAGYPDDKSKPIASADVPAVEGETTITLRDVPPGTYAIETYQDINGNDQMDTTWLGLPLEPYGFSRDAHPVLSKPPFSKVKFALHAGEQVQTLHLQSGVSVLASK